VKIKGKQAKPVMPTLWQVGSKFYIVREVNGRKRQLYLRGINAQASAVQMVAECDVAVVNNCYDAFAAKFRARKSISLQKAFDEWLKTSLQVSGNRPKVICTKTRLMKGFVSGCKKTHLSAVERADVERYVQSRNAQVSPTTAGDELTKLRTFFRFCISREWIEKNPALNVQGPKKSARTKDYVHVVGRAELELLKFKRPVYYYICYALWHTGLRIEELYRVRLEDIHECILHVRCDEERTKNAQGREVDLCQEAREMLRKCALSTLPHPETVRKVLRTACKRAKIAKITPHQFRHSRASIWHAEGLPKKNISVLLGHSGTDITENYIHPLPREMLNDAARRNTKPAKKSKKMRRL